tara:strand:- start:214 stop:1029 length:816 start_codon:yes stop_codon:yes gene_type:complete
MKFRHNKKRNTAFIYEVLIKELSKASMKNLQERKRRVVHILKSFFSKDMPLKRELDIYHSFNELSGEDKNFVQKIIFEARTQADRLNSKEIYDQKTKIINLINKSLGQESWNNFVSDYKKLATVSQVIFSDKSPKKQVMLEEKLTRMLTEVKESKKPFPNVNKLALKSFLNKFNDQYEKALNENQKNLLNKYITSYKDDGLELKMYLYEEIGSLKSSLQAVLEKDSSASPKINLILEKMNGYSSKNIDRNMITEIIKIQALVEEIKNGVQN